MTAADGIAVLHWTEQLRRFVTRFNVGLVAVACVGLLGYCGGLSRGAEHEKTRMADSVRHVLADSSKAAESRMDARKPALAAAVAHVETVTVYVKAASSKARVASESFAAERAHVVTTSDSTLRVDSSTVIVPPRVTALLAKADSLVIADSILRRAVGEMQPADSVAFALLSAQFKDMQTDRDAWKARALLDEANTPKPSRFGFRAGLLGGAALVLTVLHFVH